MTRKEVAEEIAAIAGTWDADHQYTEAAVDMIMERDAVISDLFTALGRTPPLTKAAPAMLEALEEVNRLSAPDGPRITMADAIRAHKMVVAAIAKAKEGK